MIADIGRLLAVALFHPSLEIDFKKALFDCLRLSLVCSYKHLYHL